MHNLIDDYRVQFLLLELVILNSQGHEILCLTKVSLVSMVLKHSNYYNRIISIRGHFFGTACIYIVYQYMYFYIITIVIVIQLPYLFYTLVLHSFSFFCITIVSSIRMYRVYKKKGNT